MPVACSGAWLVVGAWLAQAAAFLPGPAPQHRVQPAAELNRRCEACHTEIAREWRESFHRRSYSDRAVQRALQQEPRPFCRSCHAPEADPATAATGWSAENGVACVTCHVRPDRASTPTRSGCLRTPSASASAPATSACGRCHEFSFPDGAARVRPELMQATLSEHRESVWAEISCIVCHMPRLGPDGHRTHRFLAGHDTQLLRGALQVRATRAGKEVRITLTPVATGHALPTGDMLRRLAVTVTALGPPGTAAATQVRYLGRHFAVTAQRSGRPVLVTRRDDRVREPTTLSFVLADAAAEQPVAYRVSYQRVLFPGHSPLDGSVLRPDGATLDGEIELASGLLAAAAGRAPARSHPDDVHAGDAGGPAGERRGPQAPPQPALGPGGARLRQGAAAGPPLSTGGVQPGVRAQPKGPRGRGGRGAGSVPHPRAAPHLSRPAAGPRAPAAAADPRGGRAARRSAGHGRAQDTRWTLARLLG